MDQSNEAEPRPNWRCVNLSELQDAATLRRFSPNLAPKPCSGCRIEACRLCPRGDEHWELRLPMDHVALQRPLGMLQVPSERHRPADGQGPTT